MAAAERAQTRHRNCERSINKRVQPGWASGAEGMAMTIKGLFDPERPSTSCRSAQRLRQTILLAILGAFPMRNFLLACAVIITFSAPAHPRPCETKDIHANFY